MAAARTFFVAFVAFVALANAALAQAQSDIRVDHAWVRGTVEGQHSTGAYMTITTSTPTTLVGVKTDVASTADVHRMTMTDGAMRMGPAGPLAVTPGTPLRLTPGGYHVMMMGLTHALKPGEKVPLALDFKSATGTNETVHVDAEVVPLNATGPSRSAH